MQSLNERSFGLNAEDNQIAPLIKKDSELAS
jgi:hypothetical protein